MRCFLILFFIVTVSCDFLRGHDGDQGPTGNRGPAGTIGPGGSPGLDGHNSLIASNIADSSLCVSGGYVFTIGLDVNNNDVLDIGEVQSSAIVCNGAIGAAGAAGSNAPPTAFTPVAIVEPCAVDPNHPTEAELSNSNLEMFLKMPNGMLLATVSRNQGGDETHLGVVTPGINWESTGINSHCHFSVDVNGSITKL